MNTAKYHLWTIHPQVVWEKLQEQSVLRADVTKSIAFQNWPDSYQWMRSQMGKRLQNYAEGFPWWAWLDKRPDLRKWRHYVTPEESPNVLLELVIPIDRVLLFSTYGWNYVLMHTYIAYTEQESTKWKMELEDEGINSFQDTLPEPWESRRIASWERIFDLDRIKGYWNYDPTEAVFEELSLSDVVSVQSFASCTCKHNQPSYD